MYMEVPPVIDLDSIYLMCKIKITQNERVPLFLFLCKTLFAVIWVLERAQKVNQLPFNASKEMCFIQNNDFKYMTYNLDRNIALGCNE